MRLRSGSTTGLSSVLALCAGLSVCGNANAQGFFVSYFEPDRSILHTHADLGLGECKLCAACGK